MIKVLRWCELGQSLQEINGKVKEMTVGLFHFSNPRTIVSRRNGEYLLRVERLSIYGVDPYEFKTTSELVTEFAAHNFFKDGSYDLYGKIEEGVMVSILAIDRG